MHLKGKVEIIGWHQNDMWDKGEILTHEHLFKTVPKIGEIPNT